MCLLGKVHIALMNILDNVKFGQAIDPKVDVVAISANIDIIFIQSWVVKSYGMVMCHCI